MQGPSEDFRRHVAGRLDEIESEEGLEALLSEVIGQLEIDAADVELGEGTDLLEVIDAWASVASYAVGRFYAPASPWPRPLAGWGRSAINRLHQIAAILRRPLEIAADRLGANGWSVSVGFPWGISVGLSWPLPAED